MSALVAGLVPAPAGATRRRVLLTGAGGIALALAPAAAALPPPVGPSPLVASLAAAALAYDVGNAAWACFGWWEGDTVARAVPAADCLATAGEMTGYIARRQREGAAVEEVGRLHMVLSALVTRASEALPHVPREFKPASVEAAEHPDADVFRHCGDLAAALREVEMVNAELRPSDARLDAVGDALCDAAADLTEVAATTGSGLRAKARLARAVWVKFRSADTLGEFDNALVLAVLDDLLDVIPGVPA